MAFAASVAGLVPATFTIGPVKQEMQAFTCVSGDTSGTVTSASLSRIDYCVVVGINLTAAPTISGSTVTLAFSDPAANRAGTVFLYGR